MNIKNVLVTGSEGYIGSIIVPILIRKGFIVTGLDTCFYSEGNLDGSIIDYPLIKKDIRDITQADLEGFDAIIHLAALSNDPLGMLDQELTYEINYKASVRIAILAKSAKIKRFIFASSCSLYGQGDGTFLDENSITNPQTAYGKSKILAERDIKQLADEGFSPIFMRNATAYGISPRMRFDLVVNNLSGFAKTTGEIKILGDGMPWRPLVHISDISETMICALNAPTNIIHNQVFNVGDRKENYQIKAIAEKIKVLYISCSISIAQKNAGDTRNYKVSFDKLNKELGYKTQINLESGLKEITSVYEQINLDSHIFNHRLYTRLLQIRYLLDNNFIDKNLRWL